ncbi:MAG TPA: hypothetical protein VMU29_02785 [Smithella sp.]|nr:hypothetical protein [Smithella sp.]
MENYIPLISGLIGALIGATASIVTIIVQSRLQDKRERIKMAAQIAMDDVKTNVEIALKSGRKAAIPPPIVYLHYNIKLMELLENNKLDSHTLRVITEENRKLIDSLKLLNKEREEQLKTQKDQ